MGYNCFTSSKVYFLNIWSISYSPWNNGLFKHNSANIQPIDHISIGVEYSIHPNNISGALYHNVTKEF